jgi:cellulose biosynthesis protein BcsQ
MKIRLSDSKHICVIGKSGVGKSHMLMYLCAQLSKFYRILIIEEYGADISKHLAHNPTDANIENIFTLELSCDLEEYLESYNTAEYDVLVIDCNWNRSTDLAYSQKLSSHKHVIFSAHNRLRVVGNVYNIHLEKEYANFNNNKTIIYKSITTGANAIKSFIAKEFRVLRIQALLKVLHG